jgi:hypothetical protein
MASAAIKALVAKIPPPGSSGRRGAAPLDDGDGDEAPKTDEYGSDDDDKAAETAAAQRVASALGVKDVDADELCSALKDFISTIKE